MKGYNYELSIDSALLNDNFNFENFFNFETLNTDQYQTEARETQGREYSILFLKDKATVSQIVDSFLAAYKEKIHVTYISTQDSMEVKLSP